jgi:hypothetical protein
VNPGGFSVGALLTLCVAATTQAGLLICKDKIIGIGTPAAEVLAACGEPVSKKVESSTVRDAGARGAGEIQQSTFETWRYQAHSRKLATLVTLRDGKVHEVRNQLPK